MHRCAPLLTLALLGLLAGVPPAAEAGPGWWGDLDRGRVVDLAELHANPKPFAQQQVSFVCVVMGKADVFFQESALLSRQRFTNVAVWPDGARLWQERDFKEQDFPYLYIAKTHYQHDALLELPRFTRIEVTGRVRAILRRKPHVEVIGWRRTSHRLGPEVVDAMLRGDAYWTQGERDLAVEQYRRALRPDLPPDYKLAIQKRLGDALRALGRGEEADAVDQGGILGPGDDVPAPRPEEGERVAFPEPAREAAPFPEPGEEATPVPERPASAPSPAPDRGTRENPFLDPFLPGASSDAPPPAGSAAPPKGFPAPRPPAGDEAPAGPSERAKSSEPSEPSEPPKPPKRRPRLVGVR